MIESLREWPCWCDRVVVLERRADWATWSRDTSGGGAPLTILSRVDVDMSGRAFSAHDSVYCVIQADVQLIKK